MTELFSCDLSEPLWWERYRPKTVAECILPDDLKNTFQQFVDNKQIPNLLLSGRSGVGKTTVARAMLEQIGCDYIIINASMEGNIDKLRTDISDFASSISLAGGQKYVILDEADYLTRATQPALRNFMETFSANCGFILTVNQKNRVIPELHSRSAVIDFAFKKEDHAKLQAQFFRRSCAILDSEDIKYDKKVVAAVINKYFPDWRRVINELQRYSAGGEINAGILQSVQHEDIQELIRLMKDKNYTGMRNWVSTHNELDPQTLFVDFYENGGQFFKSNSIPVLVLLIGKYQYQAAFVANQEINLMAFLTDVLVECEFIE